MPKLTEYPEAQSFDENDILIKDGTNGTKKIQIEKVLEYMVDPTLTTPGKAADAKATKDAIDAVGEEVADVKTQITLYTGNEEIRFTNNGYIDTHGSTANVESINADNTLRYAVVECSHGDKFVINVSGGINACAFAFVAADGTVLYKADNNYVAENRLITAPVNTKWLVLNDKKTGKISYINNSVENIANETNKQLENLAEYQKFIVYSDTVTGTRHKTIYTGFPAGTYHIKIDSVNSTDTQYTSSRIVFSDGSTNGKAIDVDRTNGYDDDITFSNDVRYFVCYGAHSYSDSADIVFTYNNFTISENTELNERLKNIENALITIDNTLTETGEAADAKAVGDKFAEENTKIKNIENKFIKEYIGDDITGTRLKTINVSIPAGIYNLKIDGVTTNDSDATHTTSRMTFWDGSTNGITKDINRENGIDDYIEFVNDVNSISFYGLYNYNDSVEIEFEFEGVSILGNLFKYVDNVVNPYQDVVFGSDVKVKTTTHSHCTRQTVLDNLMSQNLTALALSNYYPSNPTYTISDCLDPDHPSNLWPLSSIPEDKITTIPDVIEIPNAEHHGMTNVNWHITTPGSMFASGKGSGQTPVGIADTWQHAIPKIKRDLLYPDGGGMIINHPTNYPLKQICDALDYDDIVLGVEFFNDTDAHWHADGHNYEETGDNPIGWNIVKWDSALKTGRRCWGFAVPDHRDEYTTDWRGTISVFVHTATQENVLKAIRKGAFYAQINHTSLALTDYVYSGNTVSISVSETATIKAIINGEEFASTSGTSMSVNLPYDSVYIRFEITTETDAIYTNPLMLKKRVKIIPA